MRSGTKSRRVTAALLGFVVACGGGTEPLVECAESVDVSVSGGTTPTISWTPACGIGYLTVQRPLSPSTGVFEVEPQWTIRSDGRLMGPPVRYGIRPRGTTQIVPPRELVAGRSYGVLVARDAGGQVILGFRAFTP